MVEIRKLPDAVKLRFKRKPTLFDTFYDDVSFLFSPLLPFVYSS